VTHRNNFHLWGTLTSNMRKNWDSYNDADMLEIPHPFNTHLPFSRHATAVTLLVTDVYGHNTCVRRGIVLDTLSSYVLTCNIYQHSIFWYSRVRVVVGLWEGYLRIEYSLPYLLVYIVQYIINVSRNQDEIIMNSSTRVENCLDSLNCSSFIFSSLYCIYRFSPVEN
jgi:hypothetical protein